VAKTRLMDIPGSGQLTVATGKPERAYSNPGLGLNEWMNYFTFGGHSYPFTVNQTMQGNTEEIRGDFAGIVRGAYKTNGVIYACMTARSLLFSEARFKFRQLRAGQPGDLFGNANLIPLEQPQPNQTTGDMLARMIQDVDIAGNWFGTRMGDRISRMRPDWVDIVLGSNDGAEAGDLDAEVVGYIYYPGGRQSGRDPVNLLAERVAHFIDQPDPVASYRGMSWLTPILREVMADNAMTSHRITYFENGATPNMIVKTEMTDPEKFQRWVDRFKAEHESTANAYKTLFLAQGADATVVGSHPKQMDFKVVQGAGETRIAAAAGVPPIIVGLSEGLQAATYSNYGQARRRYADLTMRPLWRKASGSLATLVEVPVGSELWYDERDIAFLREDQSDEAEIQQTESISIRTLLDAGFEAASVIDAVTSHDWSRLVHTGLFSVQLQPPGTQAADPSANGSGGLPSLADTER
jgi:phage portal protein BeeE